MSQITIIDHRTPVERLIEELKSTMCYLGPDCSIDACFINYRCAECGAKVDQPCTVGGRPWENPQCKEGDPYSVPRFLYHSWRTGRGLDLWKALQALD